MAEIVLACRAEQASSVADVLLRRTRLGLTAGASLGSAESVRHVAELMAETLGWSQAQVNAECDRWVDTARAEGLDPARLQ